MRRDGAAIRRWFAGLVLLEELEDADVDMLAEHASWSILEPGDRLHAADDEGAALWFLVEGAVLIGGAPDDDQPGDGIVRRTITTPGYPLGWDGMVWPFRHRWRAIAGTATRLLRVSREALDVHGRAYPEFTARLSRIVLWLAGEQLRRQHTRLITHRYDDDVDAVVALLTDRATELRVTSTLHRIPGYLRSRPTVADAFRALEAVRDGDDRVEAEIARQALDLLGGVRPELRVYARLQRVYEAVAMACDDADPAQVRAQAARALIDLFDQIEYRVHGLEHLPATPGNIVICNHLNTHPDNRLPNRFTIILDTHFVASVILYRTYGQAPVRVVRDSHWDEVGHERYYRRLGYVMVPSLEVDPLPQGQREQRRQRFADEASAVLHRGLDLVVCPEGRPGPTAGSPRRMRVGSFMIAGAVRPEPLIVPVAVANFDQRLSRAVPGALITEPFRMSDVVGDPTDREQVIAFVNDELTPLYRTWVERAANLD